MANLIELNPEPGALWNVEELGAILKHQLAAAIVPELSKVNRQLNDKSPPAIRNSEQTFGQALTDQKTPIELLKLIKDFGKIHWHSEKSGIPKEVAMVLYYAAIAHAMNHRHDSITKLSTESLRSGMQWVLDQDWVDEGIKESIRKAMKVISG